jgi:hypothetical protein
MPQISKELVKDLIATLDAYGCGAHHLDLLPLLDQPEGEPFGFVREDYTDARFNTGHIFKKSMATIGLPSTPIPHTSNPLRQIW